MTVDQGLFDEAELFKGDPLAPDLEQVCPGDIVAGLMRKYTDKRNGRKFIMVRDGRQATSDFVSTHTMGRYCWEKTLSEALMVADPVQQKALLDAMWWGDGSEFTRKTGEVVSAYSTTSKGLALQVQEILLRRGDIYGINVSASHDRPSYLVRKTISVTPSPPMAAKSGFIEDGVLWTTVDRIKEIGPQPRFNLMIAGESNYLTEGGLVHNCGAYAKPDELAEIRFWYPEMAAEIDQLEADARAAGIGEPFCRWGHGQGKASGVGRMCTSCELNQMALFEEEGNDQ